MMPRPSFLALVACLFVIACGEAAFDRDRWASGRGKLEEDNPRIGMLQDIERAGVKPGASRAFVRDLLGEPDGSDAAGDLYELGYQAVAPETAYLDIIYNSEGIVTSVVYVSR